MLDLKSMCTRAQAGMTILTQLHPGFTWLWSGWTFRYYTNLTRQAGAPWCTMVGHWYAHCGSHQSQNHWQYTQCSPTALKYMPESVKSFEIHWVLVILITFSLQILHNFSECRCTFLFKLCLHRTVDIMVFNEINAQFIAWTFSWHDKGLSHAII